MFTTAKTGPLSKLLLNFMDIILLAALTAFIFYKLSKHLGRVDEDEKRTMEERTAKIRAFEAEVMNKIKQQEVLVGASSTASQKDKEAEEKILNNLDSATKQSLQEIFVRCNITLSFFLSGAKSAFEIIIKSFAAGDLATLKTLLSDKIYQGFEAAINARKAQEVTLTTNLISLEKTEILSAMLLDNIATITVKIASKQINYISDKNGMVIEGRKDGIAEINDIWTFRKDVTSPNPNWVVSATGS